MRKRTTGGWVRLAALAGLAGFSLACDPFGDSAPREFSLDHVRVGVAYDEPVTVEGASEVGTLATLALANSSGTFTGTQRAVDAAGNEAEIGVELQVLAED